MFKKLFAKKPASAQPKPELKDLAVSNTDFYTTKSGFFESYNQDELVHRRGADVYRKMLRDPQVKAAFSLLLDIIIGRSFYFEKTSEDPIQDEIEALFRYNIEYALKDTFLQCMRYILMGKAYGFSVSEKIYKAGTFEGKNVWLIGAIKPKPFETFRFEQDAFGNISSIIQEQHGEIRKFDPKKFIVYVANREFDSVYGESDLRSAYRPYWEKDNILKIWNLHLERLAGGFIVANPKENAGNLSPAEKAQFRNILSNISNQTSMIAPAGYEIDVVHGISTDAFEKAVIHKDKQIAKALMVPNLLGFSEQNATGSLAQSEVQFETFMHVIVHQGELLADCLNENFFSDLAFYNFGTDEFPIFKFERYTEGQKREIAKIWMEAVKNGVVENTFEDEQRTRELLQYPLKEVEEEPEVEEPTVEEPTDAEVEDDQDEEAEMADESDIMAFERTEAESRIDFKELERNLDDLESEFISDLSIPTDQMFEEIVTAITESYSKLFEAKNEDAFILAFEGMSSAVSFETKTKMNRTIRDYLSKAYSSGRSEAQNNMKKASKKLGRNLSESISNAVMISKKSAIKIDKGQSGTDWTIHQFVEGLNLDTAEKYFAAKAFWITGVINQDMLDQAKLILLNGIRDEWPLDQIINELAGALTPYLGQLIDEGKLAPTEAAVASRLETIARTNIMDSFNQAQAAVYNSPEIGDFVQGFQYSAIMDSRTTPFCRTYNGRKFPRTDSIWSGITPPNHYNCRSVLIPITLADPDSERRWSAKAPRDIQPGAGFGQVTFRERCNHEHSTR